MWWPLIVAATSMVATDGHHSISVELVAIHSTGWPLPVEVAIQLANLGNSAFGKEAPMRTTVSIQHNICNDTALYSTVDSTLPEQQLQLQAPVATQRFAAFPHLLHFPPSCQDISRATEYSTAFAQTPRQKSWMYAGNLDPDRGTSAHVAVSGNNQLSRGTSPTDDTRNCEYFLEREQEHFPEARCCPWGRFRMCPYCVYIHGRRMPL